MSTVGHCSLPSLVVNDNASLNSCSVNQDLIWGCKVLQNVANKQLNCYYLLGSHCVDNPCDLPGRVLYQKEDAAHSCPPVPCTPMDARISREAIKPRTERNGTEPEVIDA